MMNSTPPNCGGLPCGQINACRHLLRPRRTKRGVQPVCVQWVAFGGGRLLAENTRDEQRKMIKYHHLVANMPLFHNVVTMTKALQTLVADGVEIDEAALACLSPYQTEHINRFGRYALKRDRSPEPLDRVRVLRMPPRSEELPAGKIK